MHFAPSQLLLVSAAAEIFVASLLGFGMLVLLQPWGAPLRKRMPKMSALTSVHLDLLMLALAQGLAAFGMRASPGRFDQLAAYLLVFSGWANVTPYVFRGFGIDAFVLAGPPRRAAAALLGLASTLSVAVGWGLLIVTWAGWG